MNSDFSNLPAEERAPLLTALLLGELPPAEAESLRAALAADPELAHEHERLRQTIELVRETRAMERQTSAAGTPLRLDDTRRQKLLETFKQPVATPVAAPRRPRDLRFLPLALAAALVGLLVVSVMLPSLAKSKARASRLSLNLPRGGSPERFTVLPAYGLAEEKRPPVESDLYLKREASVRRSGRGELEKLVEKSELALTENFSTLLFDSEAAKTAPAPKLPTVALALPAIADADGDVRELKELAGEFDGAGRAMKPLTESLARNNVNRGLARGNEVAFGNTRDFSDYNAPRAAAPSMPASQPISNNRWDKNELAGGGIGTVVPQTPAANLGTLWAETGVGQSAVVTAGASELNRSQFDTPSLPLGSVADNGAFAYVNGSAILRNSLAPSAPAVPAPALTAEQAQSMIEARRVQLQNSSAPAGPLILPPATLGDDLYVARDEKALADRQTAKHYAELAKEREVTSRGALTEVENAWSDPVRAQTLTPGVSSAGGVGGFGGGGGGRGGGNRRGDFGSGSVGVGQGGGAVYAGVSIQPGLRSGLDGRNITDLTAVEQKVDGLKDAPLAQVAEPLSERGRLVVNQSGARASGVESEAKSKAAEDRFGRADDFIVSPEMLDAVKLHIQGAPSSGGLAGMAAAKDNLSASRPSLATTPSAGGRQIISLSSVSPAPVPPPAPPASGPAAKGVTTYDFIADDAAGYIVSAGLSTNAVVNYFADLPATAGDNTLAWKFTGNDSWVGGNTIQGFNMISVIRDTPGPLGERAEKQAGLKSDANGRVEIQLPALAGEPQLSRQSSPTRPVEAKQLAQVIDNPAVTELRTDVAQAQSVRDKLERNITATEIELKTPKQGSVDILELAEAESPAKPSLWGRVAGAFSSEVERGARISVEQDMPDVDAGGRGFMAGYRPTPDPFFTQTEVERIQSKAVLGKVVEQLKLDEAWGNKTAGKKLSEDEAVALLKKKLDVRKDSKTTLIDIRAKSESAEEAARLANAVAQAYADTRKERHDQLVNGGMVMLRQQLAEKDQKLAEQKKQLAEQLKEADLERAEVSRPKSSTNSPTPQPEVLTRDNAFSTFSLNVSDVSFKLAAASLEKGAMPDVATVRSEEFINAFDYRDPQPAAGVPVAFAWERARYPFAHNRDVLRFSVKTAAQGRDGGRPLNIVLLLDNSGSMERADRVRIIQEALRALAAQLQPQDKLSVVTFSRTARLWADGVTGAQAVEVAKKIAALTPEGGTNVEEALDLAYRTALRHYAATAINRVVLLTDGAANLGNVEPAALKAKVESFRKQGVALDCFGIGWEGFNDDLLENLSRNGDGRYGFVNTPEEAATEFADQLAGALQVAASDVKVQVEFNPKRVTAYRQIGYAKHQLTKQQFRDNTVDAAEISASEAGNALYVIETNPRGEGPIATVRARFRIPQTSDYREHEWVVPFGSAVELEQSSSALRLATSASAFSEWLAGSPFAGEVTTDRLLGLLSGVPEVYGADPRPKKLEWMIRQAKSISGK